MYVCVRVCARARARACVCVCVFMNQPKIEVVQGLEHYDGFRDYSYGIMIKMQLFEE